MVLKYGHIECSFPNYGEVAVPATALGAYELDELLLVLGVVDLRDHACSKYCRSKL